MNSPSFFLQNSLKKVQFFKKTFLLADISMEVVLRISFFFFNNGNFQLNIRELNWSSYIIAEVLSTTTKVELINKKKFAKAILDRKFRSFCYMCISPRSH